MLNELIQKGSYLLVQDGIKTINSPIPQKIQTGKYQLVGGSNLRDALNKLSSRNLKPANIYDLLQWRLDHGESMKGHERIIASDSKWLNSEGRETYPSLYRSVDKSFHLYEGFFDPHWTPEYYFILGFEK